jgi:hypothetical protein
LAQRASSECTAIEHSHSGAQHIPHRHAKAKLFLFASHEIRTAISLTASEQALDSLDCSIRRLPMHKAPTVFVLATTRARDLAFEAESVTQALALARAPWFLDAVDDFLAGTGSCGVALDAQLIRTATPVEASIYCRLREELDGFTRRFLVADLSGFGERHAAKPATT